MALHERLYTYVEIDDGKPQTAAIQPLEIHA